MQISQCSYGVEYSISRTVSDDHRLIIQSPSMVPVATRYTISAITTASATTKSAGIHPKENTAHATPGAMIKAMISRSTRPPYRSEPGHQRYLRRTQTENGSGPCGRVRGP